MPEYRIFVRDLDNDILDAGFTFICQNDQKALAKTETLMDGLNLELHQGGRRVARITAPRQSDEGPSQVVQAHPAGLLTRHKQDGFQRIRYHGFLANRYRKQKLALCRQLLQMPAYDPYEAPCEVAKNYHEHYENLTGCSLLTCPVLSPGSHARHRSP
jgi:hypothetical protein